MKIILLGTAWPFRGGLASYNERLMREFSLQGHEPEIITFTTQYPSFLFPGKTQFSQSEKPTGLVISRQLNSVNPFSWLRTGDHIRKQKPDILLIKYWMPFMAPCFGTVVRRVKKNKHTKVICIADNIIPHEKKFYDRILTRWFIKTIDAFVVMSVQVMEDLARFNKSKPRALNPHPLFDNFGEKPGRAEAAKVLNLDPSKKYILFFGFIRDYKGLDLLLKAFADPRLNEYHLIIAGEYYADKAYYQSLIRALPAVDRVHQFNDFVPDEQVKYYFAVADLVVQPYKNATQSGVTQIAFHFNVPMVVTNVGGLPEMVSHGVTGFVTTPDPASIADAIHTFFQDNKSPGFSDNIRKMKERFSWRRMTETILGIYSRLAGPGGK